jgi:hypothetical protein
MTVQELINHLTRYTLEAPENAAADVALKFFDDMAYGIARGDTAKGAPGQHLLLLVANFNDKVGIRGMKIQ